MSEYKLKPCPFCGGEVTIAEGGYRQTRWMYVTEIKKIGATAMFSWKAKLTTLIPLKKTRKESKPTSSKHGISELNKN